VKIGAIHAKREQMRAGLRLGIAMAAAGLALGAAPALAQEAPAETTTNTPAADSIGPRELQNFNLQGTVTQRPQQPQAAPPAPAPQRPQTATTTAPQPTARPAATPTQAPRAQASAEPAQEPSRVASTEPSRSATTPAQAAPPSSVTVNLPPPSEALSGASTSSSVEAPVAGGDPAAASLAPRRGMPLLPWLLAALALGAGGAFLFMRSRSRPAYAGGDQFDAYVAPEPEPAPRRAPAPASAPPPKAAPPITAGIVSTRLRPWLEINFEPIRCVVDDEKVTFEFELGLFNSGSVPAREVLIEATLFNAGPEQERQIEAFFASPVGHGQRIAAIPPLQRMNLRTEVSAPKAGLQLFEIGGRHVIVPLIGFNALYRWGNSDGQTSQSFLLGRDTKSEKLAPFRMDLGPRVFRGLAARPLPQFVRN
jgi:hypothetical protein